jgi:hypothetical protein
MQTLGQAGGALTVALFLAVVANRLVEALITPIFDKRGWDKFWLMYVSWVIGGLIVWASGVNLLAEWMPSALVGQILTAVIAGGGANLIHDVFDPASRAKPQ